MCAAVENAAQIVESYIRELLKQPISVTGTTYEILKLYPGKPKNSSNTKKHAGSCTAEEEAVRILEDVYS
jgi:hypothetical protein